MHHTLAQVSRDLMILESMLEGCYVSIPALNSQFNTMQLTKRKRVMITRSRAFQRFLPGLRLLQALNWDSITATPTVHIQKPKPCLLCSVLTNQRAPVLGQLQSPALPTTLLEHTVQVLTFSYHGLHSYVEILERFCYKHNKLEFLCALVQHTSFLSQLGCKGELLGKSIPVLLKIQAPPQGRTDILQPLPPAPIPPTHTHSKCSFQILNSCSKAPGETYIRKEVHKAGKIKCLKYFEGNQKVQIWLPSSPRNCC